MKFFDTWRSAEDAGFRPCKRCSPQISQLANTKVDIITEACWIIDNAEKEPLLEELAASVGLSTSHFHRTFKKVMGITPKKYAMEKRLGRIRKKLQQNHTITEAIYEAGFASGSRFYEKATRSLGMKPSDYKNGGEGVSISYATVQSYLGWVLIAVTELGVCRIDFGESPEILRERLISNFSNAELIENDPSITVIITQILAFLEAPEKGLNLPIDIQGTAFQRRVWTALQSIHPGTTTSYKEIASKIGNPKATRAVANACAANKIAVAIPCHRVVRSDGGIGGYRWGIKRKKIILERELKKTLK